MPHDAQHGRYNTVLRLPDVQGPQNTASIRPMAGNNQRCQSGVRFWLAAVRQDKSGIGRWQGDRKGNVDSRVLVEEDNPNISART